MSKKSILQNIFIASIFVCLTAGTAFAQTTEFTYQGKLTDTGTPQAVYQMEFRLFGSAGGADQIGATIPNASVTVTQGFFTVPLDFGAVAFDGTDRFLEIAVKRNAGDPFTVLAPRQKITSAPYSITSANALKLGGVAANQFVQTNDLRLTDDRNPLPNSANYIQNTATQQASNFNINGTGTVDNLNVNGAVSLGGIAPPAPAPAGQGRIYFDAATNKVRVSENSGAFVNLVGAGGVSGTGTINSIPLWSAGTTIGNSLITQSSGSVQLPTFVSLAATASGNAVGFGNPNGETGMTISGASGRADMRFDGTTLKIVAGPVGGPPSLTNGIVIDTSGNVNIGDGFTIGKLSVAITGFQYAVAGTSSDSYGVFGKSVNSYGVYGESFGGGINSYAGFFNGRTHVGSLEVGGLGTAGATAVCYNSLKLLATCSSSLRYKKDLHPFGDGLSFINQLRPIAYKWKADNMRDIGFGAEDVAKINPLFVTYNTKGEVEGVKYDRLSVVFVNAFKEQRAQIEQQRLQIDNLKKLVCLNYATADVCREK